MNYQEDILQKEIIVWFRNYIESKGMGVIIPVPNEYTYKDKSAVIEKGASDLIVALRGRTIYVENKTLKGVQSEAQKTFEKKITALGYEYHICRNIEQFKKIIE